MDFGGYQPSLLGASSSRTQSKSKLLADEGNTWKVKEPPSRKTSVLDDIFSSDSKQASKKQPSIFEDDDDLFGGGKSGRGGGGGIASSKPFSWDDNSKTSSDKILPLRPRADNSTIHNKPTVRAVDDLDDDLEEVML